MEYLADYITGANTTLAPITNGTTLFPNTTTPGSSDAPQYPEYLGFICAIVAVLFYGSNFVPVKKYETGDGMFFQWVLCSAIFICGLCLQIARNAEFYPLLILGGVSWATGNICVVPIIKTIGLGLGMCIWGMSNLFSGWATGTFGLFGTPKANLSNTTMNYSGVALAAFSTVLYVLVKNEVSSASSSEPAPVKDDERQHLINTNEADVHSNSGSLYGSGGHDVLVFNKKQAVEDDAMFIDKMSPGSKKITGVVMSLISGLLYGVIFTPSLHIQHNNPNSSKNSLDYVFGTFCGIYLTSTVYFIIYCMIMKNKPRIYPQVILPGCISGIMWAVATCCWFVANLALKSEAVTFPIITTCPALMATIVWGVFVFKEIKGQRNYIILLFAGSLSITGAVLAGLSAA